MTFQGDLRTNKMFHFKRDFQREFYKSAILPVFEPGTLIDQLLDTVLFDGVNILLAIG